MTKIKNDKTEVSNGLELNDKDYINSLLSSLKDLSKNYIIALTEASNEFLYQKLSATLNQILSLQRKAYELMFEKGWYVLEKCDSAKINSKLDMLNQELNNL